MEQNARVAGLRRRIRAVVDAGFKTLAVNYPCPDSEASVYWHRDGVFVIFPISPGRYQVIADLPPAGSERPPTPTLEQVQTIMDRRGPSGLKALDPIWLEANMTLASTTVCLASMPLP